MTTLRSRCLSAAALLAALCLCSGCPTVPGRWGSWWTKLPLDDQDKRYFERALQGPLAPDEPGIVGGFVGWYGVILDVREIPGGGLVVTLDHRYADSYNIQFGRHDGQSIHTVSLFGGGEFEFSAKTDRHTGEWIPGNLLRVYGTVVESAAGRCSLAPEYALLFPRFAYELAPLKPERDEAGRLRRDSAGWPMLAWDSTVASAETPVDARLRANLLARWPGVLEVRCNNTFTISVALGELGGDASVQALTAAVAAETNPEWKAHFEFCLQRARRACGPEWNPKLPDPYWKNWPSQPAIDRHQPLF